MNRFFRALRAVQSDFLSVLLGNLAVLYCTVCAVRNKGERPRNNEARTEYRDTRQVDGVTLAGTSNSSRVQSLHRPAHEWNHILALELGLFLLHVRRCPKLFRIAAKDVAERHASLHTQGGLEGFLITSTELGCNDLTSKHVDDGLGKDWRLDASWQERKTAFLVRRANKTQPFKLAGSCQQLWTLNNIAGLNLALGADEQPVPSKAGIVVGVIVVRRQAEHDQASSSTSRRFFAAACAQQRAVRSYRALCEQNSFCPNHDR